ncbi:molybdopterin-synthase adenylyltransferase MoeB [Shewanella sp. VB17]|uniref:molybdopterin-synthase adenylyltransferase MoeB n=1 Tax=Shewanella sp. VB17 TaxID=2739432 RepID=UPI0015674595|nr:molybdopterin-synthase adenylyltransferase MoeB [Shewanella sp. VB17]NRD71974.1 molybdopterin-synthase adenylyltransferase MoeB [Shewanella sp. VB17]
MNSSTTNEDILSDSEILRYSRHISIKAMDFEGQEKLKLAKVLVVGVGGLGCAATQYMTMAGVGMMTLVDFDTVELSNLQRQVLHQDNNIGQPKVESAKESLHKLNPHVQIDIINSQLDDHELNRLIVNHSLVMDCTDNIKVREQLNRSCFTHKVPLVSAAAIRMEGTITSFNYQDGTPCYQCFSNLIAEQNLTCVESGILSPVVGMIGSLQAIEAIKIISNMGKPLIGKILMIDAMTMEFREMKLAKQIHCKVCANN